MFSAQNFKCTRRFLEIYPDCLLTYSMSPCQAVDNVFLFLLNFWDFVMPFCVFRKTFSVAFNRLRGYFSSKTETCVAFFWHEEQPADFQCWTLKTQRDFLPWLSMKKEPTMYRKPGTIDVAHSGQHQPRSLVTGTRTLFVMSRLIFISYLKIVYNRAPKVSTM